MSSSNISLNARSPRGNDVSLLAIRQNLAKLVVKPNQLYGEEAVDLMQRVIVVHNRNVSNELARIRVELAPPRVSRFGVRVLQQVAKKWEDVGRRVSEMVQDGYDVDSLDKIISGESPEKIYQRIRSLYQECKMLITMVESVDLTQFSSVMLSHRDWMVSRQRANQNALTRFYLVTLNRMLERRSTNMRLEVLKEIEEKILRLLKPEEFNVQRPAPTFAEIEPIRHQIEAYPDPLEVKKLYPVINDDVYRKVANELAIEYASKVVLDEQKFQVVSELFHGLIRKWERKTGRWVKPEPDGFDTRLQDFMEKNPYFARVAKEKEETYLGKVVSEWKLYYETIQLGQQYTPRLTSHQNLSTQPEALSQKPQPSSSGINQQAQPSISGISQQQARPQEASGSGITQQSQQASDQLDQRSPGLTPVNDVIYGQLADKWTHDMNSFLQLHCQHFGYNLQSDVVLMRQLLQQLLRKWERAKGRTTCGNPPEFEAKLEEFFKRHEWLRKFCMQKEQTYQEELDPLIQDYQTRGQSGYYAHLPQAPYRSPATHNSSGSELSLEDARYLARQSHIITPTSTPTSL